MSGQQRLTARCPKCCGRYKYDWGSERGLASPLSGWPGYEFMSQPPDVRANLSTSGRNLKVQVVCRRKSCLHIWWTVQFDMLSRALYKCGVRGSTPAWDYVRALEMEEATNVR